MTHKINSTSKLSKFTDRNTPAGKDNDVPDDLHDGYYGSKISNPQTHPNSSNDTIHDCVDDPTQTLSNLTPPLPSHSHILLPPPSESPAELVALEHDLSTGIPIDFSGAEQYSSSSVLVRMAISTERPDTGEGRNRRSGGEMRKGEKGNHLIHLQSQEGPRESSLLESEQIWGRWGN